MFQYLELELLNKTPDIAINIQHLRQPIPELADAAAALAPFTLPRGRARIDWAWIFKSDAAGIPTIPAVALQQFALTHWDSWLSLLRSRIPSNVMQTLEQYGPGGEQPDTTELVQATRTLFEGDRTLREKARWNLDRIALEDRPVIEALIHLYTGPDNRLLDLYGPEGSLRFVSYEQILGYGEDPLPDFLQAAVFVGYTEQVQPEQIDGFYTVFTDSRGYNLTGVEIIATTFANLLESRSLEPLPPVLHLLSIAAWAFAISTLFLRLPAPATLAVAPALAVGLLALSVYLFSRGNWLPFLSLLLFQLPVALLGALFWRYIA